MNPFLNKKFYIKDLFHKKDLEILLEKLKPHPQPQFSLEQYTIPSETASEILFTAGCIFDDIRGKRIVELGCGTGRLALGASAIGAKEVIGVDIDPLAVWTAKKNQQKVKNHGQIQWIISDIDCIQGKFDTALQNPPFGVQRRGADRRFIDTALKIAKATYSLHKSDPKNRVFIKRFVDENGGKITDLFQLKFKIPWTFSFHTKRVQTINVDLYRMECKCQ
ncbi:METTL5 family protein [[Eubacterium] cellulosolvens]